LTAIPFVDAHAHFWRLKAIHYPWLTPPFDDQGPNGSVAAIASDYLPCDHRAALAGTELAGVVHVEAGADPAMALDETLWLEALGSEEGLPSAIVGFARLDAPDVDRALARQAANPRVRGIRQILNWHPDRRRSYTPADLTRDTRWQAGFARLAGHGLSFDLQCYPAQVPALMPILLQHPETPVVLNHLGMPVLSDPDGLVEWRGALRILASLPQACIKLSGLGFVERNWTNERMQPLLQEAINLFGPARAMFASDAPTDTLFAPIERCIEALSRFADGFSPEEQRDLWGRTANRVYRLGLPL
jgi:predicted TIM-barrel fold metal-dependent hydrolase